VEPYLYSLYMPLWCGQGQLVGSILTMNGLETCVGNSDCRYITRFEVLVFDSEKYVQNDVSFVQLLFAAYVTIQGLYEIYIFSFQILCYAFCAFVMTNL
jgi:hypothetical protein